MQQRKVTNHRVKVKTRTYIQPPSHPYRSMTPSTSTGWKNEIALLFTVVVWGVNMPILKAALAAMPIHALNAARFTVSALVLGSLFLLREKHPLDSVVNYTKRYGVKIVALGLLGYVVYQLFFIIGIDRTTAGNAALIMAGAPLWTAVVSRIFGIEILKPGAWLGLLVVLAGTVTVVFAGSHRIDFRSTTFSGNVLVLIASMMWGSYTAFSRPLVRDIPPTVLSFLGILVALPILYGVAVPTFQDVQWSEVSLWVWAAIVFSGGLSTGLTFVIWATAVRNVGPSQTAVYGNLVPFVAVASSVVLLGEKLFALQLLGGAAIVSGLVLMRRARS